MSVMIEGPEGVGMVRLLAIAHSLALEINTGMKMSRGLSPLAVAQRDGITSKRTKKGALRDVVAAIKQAHIDQGRPAYEPSSVIVRAME